MAKLQHELVLALCRSLARDAAKSCVLVFVAGMADIVDLTERLEACGGAVDGAAERRFECVPVHSEIAAEDQVRAFVALHQARMLECTR